VEYPNNNKIIAAENHAWNKLFSQAVFWRQEVHSQREEGKIKPGAREK
jgi:hypothetical protein